MASEGLKPIYIPGYVDPDIASQEFDRLWNHLAWERRPDAPRREYWMNNYGLPYTYGRGAGTRTYDCQPWDDFMLGLMERMNREFGYALDCCFMNGYESERDGLGWHADDSPEMNPEEPVISFSLGAERAISVRNNETRVIESFMLGHGSLFVMPPRFQLYNEHKIPKAPRPVPPRISGTYRGMILL